MLIVDDEPIVLEGLRWLIDWNRLQCELIGEAHDGEDAMKLIEEHHPDLVITDIRMPVIDGLTLIKQTLERYPTIQFIILSGYADFAYARQAIQYGVCNYLTKPIDENELECAVEATTNKIVSRRIKQDQIQVAEACIQVETVNRLLLGETCKEWVTSTREQINLLDSSRVRCIQVLPKLGDRVQPIHWLLNASKRITHSPGFTGFKAYPYRISKDYQGVLLISNSAELPLSSDLVNKVISFLQATGESLSFSVSNEHQGTGGLHIAYQEAVAAGICKITSTDSGIYYFHDKAGKDIPRDSEELKHLILRAIAEGNPEGVRHYTKDLLIATSNYCDSKVWSEAFLSMVKLEALKVLMQQGADQEEWARSWFAATTTNYDPGGFKCRWIKELVEAAEWVAASQEIRVDGAIHAAKEYIKLHYRDRLRLQQVADHLHLNAAYLGQRFKKQLGVTFNEYLHSVRVEEAKKLLRRAEMKHADIASCVGYSDPDHFVAKFKALTGMLPSAYKKSCQSQE